MGNPAGAANLGNAYGKIIIDTSGVRTAVNEARQSLNGLQSLGGGIQSLGSSLTGFGTQMSLALAPVTGFVTQGIFAFSRFQDVMTEISARTGLVGDDLEAIRQAALQFGADTSFSATQAAEAFLQLTSSGQTAEEALATLPSVLALAAAGGIDLGYAADSVTDIMAQFGLGVDQASVVANALSAAAASSSANVSDLTQGFANAGPVANLFGLSVEETAAVLAIFAENGIKGAEAGTQLKSMLTNMMRPTEDVQGMWEELGVSMVDAEGNMRPLNDVIQDLGVSMADMTEAERIETINTLAGSYGQVGLAALLAAGGLDDMLASMDSQAAATIVAAARMNTFSGRIESLKGSIETLSINLLGPLVENYLTPLVDELITVVNLITDWIIENEDLAAAIGLVLGVLAIIGPVIAGIGLYVTALGAGLSALGALLGFVAIGVGLLLSPIGLAVIALAALGAGIAYVYQRNLLGFRTTIQNLVRDFANLRTEIRNLAAELMLGALGLAINIVDSARSFIDAGASLGATFWDAFVTAVSGLVRGGLDTIKNTIQSQLGGLFAGGLQMPSIDLSSLINLETLSIGSAITMIGRLQTAVGLLGTAFSLLLSPLGLALAGIALLGGALYLAYTENLFGFKDAIDGVIQKIGSVIPSLQGFAGEIIKFGTDIIAAFQSGGIGGAITAAIDGIQTNVPKAIESAKSYAPAMAAAFTAAMVEQGPTIQRGAQQFGDKVEEEGPIVAQRGGWMAGLLTGDFLVGMIEYGPSIVAAIGFMSYTIANEFLKMSASLAGFGLDLMSSFATGFSLGILVKLPEIWAALKAQWNALIYNPLKEEVNRMGKDIADGFKTGFGLANLGEWVRAQFDAMVQKVKDFLGIHSPSTLFASFGQMVGQGFVNGLLSMVGPITAAAGALLAAVTGPLNRIITLAGQALSAAGGVISSTVGAPIGGDDQREVPMPPGLQLPGRAGGGPTWRGKSYIVGDGDGPEVFTPNANGGIMPNDVWQALQSIAVSLSGPSLASAVARAGGGNGGGVVYQIAVSVPADLLRDEPNLQRNAETFADNMRLALQKRSLSA